LDSPSRGIVVHGFVQDLQPIIDSVRLNIAPLRFGAGAKGKVVQALLSGLPTVGTPIAFEGMNLRNQSEVDVAQNDTEFISKIKYLYTNEKIWQDRRQSGLKVARNLYGIDSLRSNIEKKIIQGLQG